MILELAHEFGRKVAFLGRSMNNVMEITHNLGLLNIPDGVLLRPQDIMTAPKHKVCILASGTQGEPMSALSRIAVDNHKNLSVEPGDTVVLSSRIIPGNEKGIGRMMNHMAKRGADIMYGSMNPPIHVSGHGSAEELRLVLNLVRPRYFIPVHGEYLQMSKHAALASHLLSAGLEKAFVLETGQTVEIDHAGARMGPKVAVGRVCIDSGSLDEVVEDIIIRDRRHLSEDGFVIPIIAISKSTGKSESLPELVSRGFVSMEEGGVIMKEARQVVARTIETSSAEERTDWGVMQEKIRADLRRYLNKHTQRRPLIMPVILEV
jgi:ribonuclease J